VVASETYTGSREQYEKELKEKISYRGGQRDISMNLSGVDDATLLGMKRKAFFQFYFNPARAYRLWRVTPVKRRLFKNFINVLSEIVFRRWLVQA
jgi:hypothetical protein